jgi:hypothetical protein
LFVIALVFMMGDDDKFKVRATTANDPRIRVGAAQDNFRTHDSPRTHN